MITIDMRFIQASGIGTYIKHLIPGVLEKMPSQEFALIGSPEEIKDIGIAPNSRIRIIEAKSKMYSLAEQFELPRLIPKNTSLFFSPHYPIPLAYRGKLLVTIHDVFHLAMPKLVGGLHKLIYAKLMFWSVCKKASAILVDSQFTRSELEKYIQVSPSLIHPIHLGVDPSWYSVEDVNQNPTNPYFVFVGNVKPNKNLVTLIQAFSRIHKSIPHNLVIIGKRNGFITTDPRVEEIAAKISDRIIFTDFLPDTELKTYIKGATALVFPSLYEGFGLPPLEAMASGCPVICSDRASLPEVCGDAVLYCNPESIDDIALKMEMLASNTILQDDLRKKGLLQSRRYVWSKCINQTVDVIERLLK